MAEFGPMFAARVRTPMTNGFVERFNCSVLGE